MVLSNRHCTSYYIYYIIYYYIFYCFICLYKRRNYKNNSYEKESMCMWTKTLFLRWSDQKWTCKRDEKGGRRGFLALRTTLVFRGSNFDEEDINNNFLIYRFVLQFLCHFGGNHRFRCQIFWNAELFSKLVELGVVQKKKSRGQTMNNEKCTTMRNMHMEFPFWFLNW